MNAVPLRDSVLEFFTLRRAEGEARALEGDVASAIVRDLAVAFQRRKAAETLWPRESAAEAIKLARAALEGASSSLAKAATLLSPTPSWIESARAVATAASAEAPEIPDVEADVRAEHETTFRAAIEALAAIEGLAGHLVAGRRGVARLRRQRAIVTALSGVAGVALLFWLLPRAPALAGASASGSLDPSNSPERAIDGDPHTDWFPPEGELGWIEVTLGKSRAVNTVRVVLGNPPWGDRGTKDARIEARWNGIVVKGVDVTLPAPQKGDVVWFDVVLGAGKIDHVRFIPRSFYGHGAALAEIEVK